MAEKLISWPDLIKDYRFTDDPAMICAIGRKIKIVSEAEDLDILETLTANAKEKVTKGFVINAIAEILYAGYLRVGDDLTIEHMLDELGQSEQPTVLTNVARVRAMLDVARGIKDRQATSKVADA